MREFRCGLNQMLHLVVHVVGAQKKLTLKADISQALCFPSGLCYKDYP